MDVPAAGSRPRWQVLLARPLRRLVAMVLYVAVLVLWVWGMLALRHSNLPGEEMRILAARGFGLVSLAAFLFMRNLWRAALYFFGISIAVVTWWFLIPASNDRDWVDDLAVLPRADIDGDRVTVHNVRNFDWTGPTRFEPAYDDRTYDLNDIEGVDLILSYWDEIRLIAHTILSFRFGSGEHLAVSIEIRREKGEEYAELKGIFKQFELYYVVADERDVIRVRTNFRNENVYLYPTLADRKGARALFLDYMRRINELAEKPEFYHTLLNNCTTNIVDHVNRVAPTKTKKILLNGYSDELAYQAGWLDSSLPYAETRRRHRITDRALAAGDAVDFSARIRQPLEGEQSQ